MDKMTFGNWPKFTTLINKAKSHETNFKISARSEKQ